MKTIPRSGFRSLGKKPATYSPKDMGFRGGKKDQGWNTLQQILSSPDHSYYIGPSYDHEYHKKRRRVDRLNERLNVFLRNHFGIEIPRGFRTLELRRDEKSGTYKPRFQVVNPNDTIRELRSELNHYSDTQVMNRIDKLTSEILYFEETKDVEASELRRKQLRFCQIALDRGITTNEELKKTKLPDLFRRKIEDKNKKHSD